MPYVSKRRGNVAYKTITYSLLLFFFFFVKLWIRVQQGNTQTFKSQSDVDYEVFKCKKGVFSQHATVVPSIATMDFRVP